MIKPEDFEKLSDAEKVSLIREQEQALIRLRRSIEAKIQAERFEAEDVEKAFSEASSVSEDFMNRRAARLEQPIVKG